MISQQEILDARVTQHKARQKAEYILGDWDKARPSPVPASSVIEALDGQERMGAVSSREVEACGASLCFLLKNVVYLKN